MSTKPFTFWPMLLVLLFASSTTYAQDQLTTDELRSLCNNMSSGNQYQAGDLQCQRYIKGFVDGLIMANQLNIEQQKLRSSFSERAINSRISTRLQHEPRYNQQKICIDGDKAFEDIVDTIAHHIVDAQPQTTTQDARHAVYNSLLTHFKCST